MSDSGKSEDFQLVSEAKNDPRKFGALYKKYYERIYRYCYYRLHKNREITEDIVSEVFIKALESIERYDDRGSPFLVWLYTIARNLIIDYVKSGKVRYEGSSASIDWTAGGHDVEKEVENKDLMSRIGDVLESLAESDRELLTLKFTSGLTFSEISKVLGIKEGAAKMRYYRLIEDLNGRLE